MSVIFLLILASIGFGHIVYYAELPRFWLSIAAVCVPAALAYSLLHWHWRWLGCHALSYVPLATDLPANTPGKSCKSLVKPFWGWIASKVLSIALFTSLPISLSAALLKILIVISVFSVSAAMGTLRLNNLLETQLPSSRDKTQSSLVFTINAILDEASESKSRRATRFQAVVNEDVEGDGHLATRTLNLSWYSPPALTVGQTWRANIMLRRPRGMVNPGGFDYGAWLLGQGIVATGYRSGTEGAHQLNAHQPKGFRSSSLHDSFYSVRHELKQRLNRDQSIEHVRFFQALLLGDKNALTGQDWEILQATGTIHLLAISGLHIGLIAGVGFILGLVFVRGLAWLLFYRTLFLYRIVPPLFSIALATWYALLAGLPIPTQRALFAVILLNMASFMGIRLSRFHVLAWVFFCVTVIEPFAWRQTGFWLSFAAVCTLLCCFYGRVGRQSKWRTALEVQGILSIAMCLPLWLLGLPASVLSPVANMLAVPLIAFFFVPGLFIWLLLSMTSLGPLLLQLLDFAFAGLWWCLEQLAVFPFALLRPGLDSAAYPSAITGVLAALGLLIVAAWLLPKTMSLRLLSAGIVVMLSLHSMNLPDTYGPRNNANGLLAEMVVLDVGQGLAVALHQGRHAWLYDTGAHFSDRFNIGSHVILPYLHYRGVKRLSLMVSHGDTDHAGGALPILTAYRPASFLSGDSFLFDGSEGGKGDQGNEKKGDEEKEQVERVPAEPCYQGQSWHEGRVHYEVLWPPALLTRSLSSNNRSCVVLVTVGGSRILLPGDIEASVERQLVEQGLLPDIDVLIAPHHGSKTSSTQPFLAALKPEHIIVSAGYKNRYGHPHSSVTARYRAIGAEVWHTGHHGAIRLQVKQDGFSQYRLSIVAWREQSPKLWY